MFLSIFLVSSNCLCNSLRSAPVCNKVPLLFWSSLNKIFLFLVNLINSDSVDFKSVCVCVNWRAKFCFSASSCVLIAFFSAAEAVLVLLSSF